MSAPTVETGDGEANDAVAPSHHPTLVASALAVLATATAVGVVATAADQRFAVGVALAGVAGLWVGVEATRRGYTLAGTAVALVGAGVALASLAVGAGASSAYGERAELVPGLLGVVLVGVGVLGLHRQLSRRAVSAGLAAVVVGAALGGLFHSAGLVELLAAVALAVVGWDAGEQAINLGEQLGREARTWPAELGHVGATAAVGAVAVALATLLSDVELHVPLAGLVVLLAATVALLAALYR